MTEQLTRAQFRTLTQAFRSMPDETLLYPTHGGGSFCSVAGGTTRTSTLGLERASNPMLNFGNEDEFVRWFPTTFPAATAYYFRMRAFNAAGPRLRAEIPAPPLLSVSEFADRQRSALVIDARSMEAHASGHIPGAMSIAFRDSFAVWLGWLVPANTPLLFVADDVPIERVLDDAMLVGYERFAGVLEGGMAAWRAAGKRTETSKLVHADEARKAMLAGALAIDVRERSEFEADHVPEAIHIPLGELAHRVAEIPTGRPLVAYCGHGERAASAVSLLERAGRGELMILDGGMGAWREHDQEGTA